MLHKIGVDPVLMELLKFFLNLRGAIAKKIAS